MRPSNKHLNRLGDDLRNPSSCNYDISVDEVSSWRGLHETPLQRLNSSLRTKLKKLVNSPEYKLDESYVVSRRLKRMPSIEAKLRRFNNMQLSRIEDIGGLRVVLKDMRHIRVFLEDLEYYKGKAKTFIITRERNYIDPEDDCDIKKDGYKSYHQIYKYLNGDLAGLKIELQIRTILQHAWATAVETLGIIEKTPFKSGKGDQDYKEFFTLVSVAFSHLEKTSVLQEYKKYSLEDICKKIQDLNNRLKVIEYLKTFSVTHDKFEDSKHYYVMRLDIDNQMVRISSYDKRDFEAAELKYKDYEQEVEREQWNWEVVLISINDIKKLKMAYPNYFLDAKKFVEKLGSLLSKYA